MLNTVAFSGPICAGKDFVASVAGFHRIGFSYPIYRITNALFGIDAEKDKKNPEVRRFLQRIGEWGRGGGTDFSPERALMTAHLRAHGSSYVEGTTTADWRCFGTEQFWTSLLLRRYYSMTHAKIAVTGVRLPVERTMLESSGFIHYAVMASRLMRELRCGGTIPPEVTNDITETWSSQWFEELKLSDPARIIWNDIPDHPERPKGSITVSDFVELAR